MARLLERYRNEIVPHMMARFGYRNVMQVPRLEKVVLNMGVGRAVENAKRLEEASRALGQIAGQKPVVTQARKSIAGFKLRKGMNIGCMVTIRGDRMYEFIDRLVNVVIPRIRDFRGLPTSSFDGRGNYALGLAEQIVFPEIDIDSVENVLGLNVVIAIKNASDEEALELLGQFGFPFRRN
ncbi:MAG: 50S ribosomal protein L5 [Planctomycetes bacterium]|nr:50S ribosomal protein L5 [Planctomycetota bacterium]